MSDKIEAEQQISVEDKEKGKLASGIHMAIGCPGLPFIQYPGRVTNAVVSTIEEVNARQSITPLNDYRVV